MTAIESLTKELSKLTDTEATLAAAVQAVATAFSKNAADLADMTQQLANAHASNNDAAIEALIPQFDAVADKFVADATTLQGAVPTPPQT